MIDRHRERDERRQPGEYRERRQLMDREMLMSDRRRERGEHRERGEYREHREAGEHHEHHRHCDGAGYRCAPESQVRNFIQPWLLLLLTQKRAHGYELMEELSREEDAPGADPGLLYRTLRQFEQDGLVRSSWDTEGRGAARRVYEITAEGVEYLQAWVVNVRRTRERLDRFLTEYESYFEKKEGE